jgi:hypothetical protein
MVGLTYVVLFDEWLIVRLGFSAQLDHLHSNVVH